MLSTLRDLHEPLAAGRKAMTPTEIAQRDLIDQTAELIRLRRVLTAQRLRVQNAIDHLRALNAESPALASAAWELRLWEQAPRA